MQTISSHAEQNLVNVLKDRNNVEWKLIVIQEMGELTGQNEVIISFEPGIK